MTESKPSAIRTEGVAGALVDRKITAETAKKYGVTIRMNNDGSIKNHLYPYYKDGEQVAQKIRDVQDKDFRIEGTVRDAELFGMDTVQKKGKYITITEGECDAMAAYELMGSKWAVVSVINGASSAPKDVKRNLEFFNEFETIVICFDADKAGRDAAKKVAELFPPSKAKIMTMPEDYKDANEMLKVNKKQSFMESWWNAKLFAPDGIVRGDDMWGVVTEEVNQSFVEYPWQGLNELTYGIRTHELVTITAGSGMGKSQIIRELVFYLMNLEDSGNVGLLMLEESIKRTGLSLMSLSANQLLHLPDVHIDKEELKKHYDATLGTGKVFLYDSFGSNSVDNIIARVRYMAKGLDCKYIFLDHISLLVSDQQNGDERKALDEISTKLRTLVQETGIALFMVSHLRRPGGTAHEEGGMTSLSQLRGSAGIGQLSDMVIGLERNGQDDDPVIRNTTTVRVLKNRFSGLTGPACYLHYDKDTGRMNEVDNPNEAGDTDEF
ncbi:MAG: bifunctional DNA primase/helicase [Candidatus Marinimicrobia bacterium]|nr:bifunctional DNA primase/helicase [Candidatus Neomarinimicrobiota bacterium]MBT5235912.1 bifunctional DNA primase/helicase [Candidatus Neomarinimicrobiota bacterium]